MFGPTTARLCGVKVSSTLAPCRSWLTRAAPPSQSTGCSLVVAGSGIQVFYGDHLFFRRDAPELPRCHVLTARSPRSYDSGLVALPVKLQGVGSAANGFTYDSVRPASRSSAPCGRNTANARCRTA